MACLSFRPSSFHCIQLSYKLLVDAELYPPAWLPTNPPTILTKLIDSCYPPASGASHCLPGHHGIRGPLCPGTWVSVQSPLPLPSSPSRMPQQKWSAENALKAPYFCILCLCVFCTWDILSIPRCFWLSFPLRTSNDITSYRRPSCTILDSKKLPSSVHTSMVCIFTSLHFPHCIICCVSGFSSTMTYSPF